MSCAAAPVDLLALALLFAAVPALSQDYLPRDVQRYVDRREGCDQLRGDRVNEVSQIGRAHV